MPQTGQFWRLARVIEEVGLSRSQIYRLAQQGDFPKPRRYPASEASFWLQAEVEEWKAAVIGQPVSAGSELALLG